MFACSCCSVIIQLLLLSNCLAFSPGINNIWHRFGFTCTPKPHKNKKNYKYEYSERPPSVLLQSRTSRDEKNKNNQTNFVFSTHLIEALDLEIIINDVSTHTGSKRAYEAFQNLIQRNSKHSRTTINSGYRFEAVDQLSNERYRRYRYEDDEDHKRREAVIPIAKSIEEVHREYAIVEEAISLLKSMNTNYVANDGNGIPNLMYPPLYGKDSSPYDVDSIPYTDDDDFLYLQIEDFTAEHILQAEQVVNKLLEIRKWSHQEAIKTLAPNIAQIASMINEGDSALSSILQEINGNVEIVRCVLTTVDQASYSIRINDDYYPILRILRQKEEQLFKEGGKELDKNVVAIRNEIENTTADIVSGLAQKIIHVSKSIECGLEILAQLDIIFAKAAYAVSIKGVVPLVQNNGDISIKDFLHPILLKSMSEGAVVPIDLRLSSETGKNALVISGPNGGGKTLAMKSFGLVSVLTKLGILIPIKEGGKRPRVDYFDTVQLMIGDQQNIINGESTWTSTLNSCATIIQSMETLSKENKNSSHLVLIDELGTGTDPSSGGFVGQAILEELTKYCKVVVTTHLPRLKALSYSCRSIGCAAVILDYSDIDSGGNNREYSKYRRPSFELHYDLIGESHALNAAFRCTPSLPDSVLTRASNLLDSSAAKDEETGTNENYIKALKESMEEQLKRTKDATSRSEDVASDLVKCRRAMVSLARSYECHLDRRMESLEASFQRLKANKSSDLELVGSTLSELKLVKKKIRTQKELLADKGLRVLPTDYVLNHGESVVIISDGKWEGMTAKVILLDASNPVEASLGPNEVIVKPSWSLNTWDDIVSDIDPMEDRPLILQRHEIAIWNVESLDDYDGTYRTKPATSISDSKRKVNSLLSTLNSLSSSDESKLKKKRNNTFQSSRQRKSANKAKKKGK